MNQGKWRSNKGIYQGENDTLKQSTIGKIKEMVNNLDLEVSCKI